MKNFYFVLFLLITETGVSQEKNSVTHDQDTLVKTSSIQTDSIYTLLPGMTDSGFVYILPNSLIYDICHRPKSSLSFNFNSFLNWQDFFTESHYNAKGARQDLKAGTPKILFHYKDGITFAPEKDQRFQNKYGIEFFAPTAWHMAGQGKNKKGYNQVIFAYLDKKYGTEWRSELRPDAIGFETREDIDQPSKQLETSLRIPRVAPHSYARFPAPTDPDERRQLLIIKIVSVSLVFLLILYLLFRKRKSI